MKRRQFLLTGTGVAAGMFLRQVLAAQPCPPGQLSVDGGSAVATNCPSPSGGTLASVAASMAAGTWAQLTPAGQDAALGVGPTSGSMIHYCNSMPWNSFNKSIEIVGMDHNAGLQRYVRYDANANSFNVIAADDGVGTATRHGYDHSAVNPFTGDLYHRLAEYNYEGTGILVYKRRLGASAFSAMARVPTLFYMQNAIGVTWWSGTFAGAGSQGCLLIYNSGDSAAAGSAIDGGMYAYDPLADKWFWSSRSMSPNYGTAGESYHSVLEYSAVFNCAVYGGGNDNPSKLWRMDADRSVHALTNVPSGKGVGVQRGNLVADPVTGKFLLLSAGELWELDPRGSGTWTKQAGSRVPPAGVGDPAAPDGVISSAISDYRVIVYVTQTSRSNGTLFVYKHA